MNFYEVIHKSVKGIFTVLKYTCEWLLYEKVRVMLNAET